MKSIIALGAQPIVFIVLSLSLVVCLLKVLEPQSPAESP